MRHYVPKSNNPNSLPHDLYMQMLYIIRDYAKSEEENGTPERIRQRKAVRQASCILEAEYKKRPAIYGEINPLQAFFDYPYFSFMFAQQGSEMGAGKRSWNLYRSRFAHLVAKRLQLF